MVSRLVPINGNDGISWRGVIPQTTFYWTIHLTHHCENGRGDGHGSLNLECTVLTSSQTQSIPFTETD